MPFLTIFLQCHSPLYRDIQLLPVDPDPREIPSGGLRYPILHTRHRELLCHQDPHGNHPHVGQGDPCVPQAGHTAQRKGMTPIPLTTPPTPHPPTPTPPLLFSFNQKPFYTLHHNLHLSLKVLVLKTNFNSRLHIMIDLGYRDVWLVATMFCD